MNLVLHGFLTVLLVLAALPREARGCYGSPDCTLPPSDAWGSGGTMINGGATFDTSWVPFWSGSQSDISIMWNGLEMEQCDWDEGWGFEAVANLNKPLSRLMNAAYLIRIVENRARLFGLKRPISGIPDAKYAQGFYWGFASEHGADEWEPSCEDDGAVASHRQDADEYNKMHIPGSYRRAAALRASTVVHETTHQDVSHIGASGCIPSSESCDAKYGDYNSNTMQVNFLHDAVIAYQMEPGTNGPVRTVAISGGQCSFIPWFSSTERTALLDLANTVIDRFQSGPPGAWKFQISGEVNQKMAAETWPCAMCNTADYDWTSNVCGQKACNEDLNSQNAGVNLNNKIECIQYSNEIQQNGLTPESTANAWNEFQNGLQSCFFPNPTLALQYCQQEMATAIFATQVDECGYLDEVNWNTINKYRCRQQFCHNQFQLTGGAGWGPGATDPFGCLDTLCGGEQCGDAGDQQACVFEFLMAQGDPLNYVGQCELAGCKRVLVDCLVGFFQNGLWSYGEPYPAQCVFLSSSCEVMSKLASLVWINSREFLDPIGPVSRVIDLPFSNNPAKGIYRYAEEIRRQAAAGASDAELEQMAEDFTSLPELAAALYHLAPAKFVGLYGSQGFDEILGPSVARVAPEAFDPDELTPAGQAALAEFNRLLNALPPQGIKGTIGSFAPER